MDERAKLETLIWVIDEIILVIPRENKNFIKHMKGQQAACRCSLMSKGVADGLISLWATDTRLTLDDFIMYFCSDPAKIQEEWQKKIHEIWTKWEAEVVYDTRKSDKEA